MVLFNFFYTFYESYFFPGQTPVPPRSWLWILDLSHDPFWAIWLAEVTKSHQHHDRISNLTPHITGHVISVTYPYRELGFKLIHDVRRRGPCNESSWLSVPCLREWLGLPAYESIEIMICHLSGIGISIIKIRYQYHKTQVYIDLPVRWHLYIETDSRGPVHERFSHRNFNPMDTWF